MTFLIGVMDNGWNWGQGSRVKGHVYIFGNMKVLNFSQVYQMDEDHAIKYDYGTGETLRKKDGVTIETNTSGLAAIIEGGESLFEFRV